MKYFIFSLLLIGCQATTAPKTPQSNCVGVMFPANGYVQCPKPDGHSEYQVACICRK